MATNPFLRQRFQAQSAGIAIVRSILKREFFPNGFTTAQLYKLAVKEAPPADFQAYPLPPPTPRPVENKKKRKYQKPEPLESYPPHPEHPVRSVRFLKDGILPFLRGAQEISMSRQPTAKTLAAQQAPDAPKTRTHLTSSQVEWVWKVIPPEQRSKPPAPSKEKVVVGTEVGVGLDTSHLNKRRKRARVEKVSGEVLNLKAYNRYSQERDGLMERLDRDPELKLKMADALRGIPASKSTLKDLLAKEKQLNQGRSSQRTALTSTDSEEHLRTQTDKIRRLVAYKFPTGEQPRAF